MMPSNHLTFCCPLFLPSVFPSIRVFSDESALCIRWPKYWSFSFSISPSNEYSGLISFRMDWLDLLAVQQTVKSLPQPQSWKAAILWRSAFFMVQLSHPYMTIFLDLRTAGWQTCAAGSHQVCGNLLQRQQEANTFMRGTLVGTLLCSPLHRGTWGMLAAGKWWT